MDDYSAQFIYKPPIDSSEKLKCEFGSSQAVRFLGDKFVINLKDKENTICLDCDAKSLAFALEEINLDNPDENMIEAMKKMKKALLFILWNTDWPVGD